MSRDEVNEFLDKLAEAQQRKAPLSEYLPHQIAEAINQLIAAAVEREREACAMIAESAAEASDVLAGGEVLETNPIQKDTALEIADQIRHRE